ncbi:MAG: hypothetical protein LBP85_04770 [Prevotellaceae bacterium]|jgi:hypothetical protein|nr:hypothetical protein [Prevotellaceae bacterium]
MENLAATVKNIYANHKDRTINTNDIQHFDRYFKNLFLFYDLEDLVKNIASDEEIITFQNIFNKIVLFAQSPPVVYRVPINTYCGLSSYIFGINRNIDDYYKTLDWYKDIY